MNELKITAEHSPASADMDIVHSGLRDFNMGVIGDAGFTEVGAFLRDNDGRVVGGATGHIRWRWLYVAKLWLPTELRGKGHGKALMRAVEQMAWQSNCLGVYLDTFEYQARPFYEALGYECVGRLEGYPPGYRQFFMRKAAP